jgi:hypothetical protein
MQIYMQTKHSYTSKSLLGWRCTPLMSALRRQRQVDLWIGGQPGLQSEFQDSQGYTEKPCLKEKRREGRGREGRGGEGREGRGGEGRGGEGEIKTNILGAEEVAPWLRALAVWSIPKHPHGSPQPFITPVPGEAKAAFWLASSGTACTRSTGIHWSKITICI